MDTEPITQTSAVELLDDACDAWDEVEDDDVTQDDVNRVEEMLHLSSQAMDRDDFTGAWLWAGNALGYIRERLEPLPATA